jgi:hypothetical protein
MKFLVDAPLGGLAKWLRFLGFDADGAVFKPGALPPPLQGTVLLTVNRRLANLDRPDVLVLTGREKEAQLQEVCRRLGLSWRGLKPLSRCVRCNRPLADLPREEARSRVPEHIYLTQKAFFVCPACNRVYWPGSHLAGITRTLDEVMGCTPPGGGPSSTRSSS